MLSFGFKNISGNFFLPWRPVNILGGTLFNFCRLLNMLFPVVFSIYLGITSPALMLLHFDLEKHHWYFALKFLTTVDLFYYLFWIFQTINKDTVPSLFAEEVEKRKYYLSVNSLRSEKSMPPSLLFHCLYTCSFFRFLPF